VILKSQLNGGADCYLCKMATSSEKPRYLIYALPGSDSPSGLSARIIFHKECFKEVAGDRWLLEGY